MIIALSTCYSLIFLAFFPLFIAFIRVLKRSFIEVYLRMRIRLYITFALFMICVGFRLCAYYVIQFSSLPWLSVETVRGEIPLYISEIFIALCYMKVMSSLYQKEKRNKAAEDINDPEIFNTSVT